MRTLSKEMLLLSQCWLQEADFLNGDGDNDGDSKMNESGSNDGGDGDGKSKVGCEDEDVNDNDNDGVSVDCFGNLNDGNNANSGGGKKLWEQCWWK